MQVTAEMLGTSFIQIPNIAMDRNVIEYTVWIVPLPEPFCAI